MSIRNQIVTLMQQRAFRRVYQTIDGRWHLSEVGEVDGETVRAMIKDGTLVQESSSSYSLSQDREK